MMRGTRDRLAGAGDRFAERVAKRLDPVLDRWSGVGLFVCVVLLGVVLVGALASALAALLYGVPS